MSTVTVEIDINEYLSEEEKKEIAIDTFRGSLVKGLTERTDNKTNYENYERVISNSVYHYLEDRIDSILGCDVQEMIKEKTLKTLKDKDYTHSLFRRKSAWEKEDSLAIRIQDEAVKSHKEEMTKKIHDKLNEVIGNMDADDLYEMYKDAFDNFIVNRLK